MYDKYKKLQEAFTKTIAKIMKIDPNDMTGMICGWAGGMKIPGLS